MTVFPPCLTRPNAREAVSGEISKGIISTRSRGCFALRISALSLFPRQIDRPVCPPKGIGAVPESVSRGNKSCSGPAHARVGPEPRQRVRWPGQSAQTTGACEKPSRSWRARFCEAASSVTIANTSISMTRQEHVRALPGVRTQCDRLLNATSDALPADGSVRRMNIHASVNRLTASTACVHLPIISCQ